MFLASARKVIQPGATGQDWEGETRVLILNLVSQQIRPVSCPRCSTRQSPGKEKHVNGVSAQVVWAVLRRARRLERPGLALHKLILALL